MRTSAASGGWNVGSRLYAPRYSRTAIASLSALAPVLAVSDAPAQQPSPYTWQGFYLGTHTGGALGLPDVANPFGPSIFGDTVRTPGPGS